MSKSQLLKTVCWGAVGGFAVSSCWFGLGIYQAFAEAARSGSPPFSCDTCATHPLGVILSIGAPIGLAGVVALGILWRRGMLKAWTLLLVSLLHLVCTTSLLIFGIRFFRDSLPGFFLSDIVWWLRPVGKWFGV